MLRKLPVLLLALAGSYAAAATQDPVVGMCQHYGDSENVCSCAADGLRETVGSDEYSLYEAVGEGFLAQLEDGLGLSDAWDAGVESQTGSSGRSATGILQVTNAVGRAHRDAIKACSE